MRSIENALAGGDVFGADGKTHECECEDKKRTNVPAIETAKDHERLRFLPALKNHYKASRIKFGSLRVFYSYLDIHRQQEFDVALRFLHLFDEEFDAFDDVQILNVFAQEPHALQFVLVDEQLFFARAA